MKESSNSLVHKKVHKAHFNNTHFSTEGTHNN